LRHSHVFLGKLFALIRDRYPALLQELQAAGARELAFLEGLPPTLRTEYQPLPGDADMSIIFSRRTTLEYVMRRYAQTLPGVTFLTDTLVRGLLTDRSDGVLNVRGLKVERPGPAGELIAESLTADIVIDATGRSSVMPDWLRAVGVVIEEEESPAGILYFTRHYRLRDGAEEPPRGEIPGAGDLGYIKYGIFVADNRHFSLTLSLPEIETELRKVIVRPEIFDRIAAALPGAGQWTDTARAEPVSKVFSMGNLKNLWRRYLKDGEPQVLNFFAIGDAAIRTNPLYGRGCSSGVMQAHILADVLAETTDPRERARLQAARNEKDILPHFKSMSKQDAAAIRRALNEQNPAYRPGVKARWMKSFAEDAIIPSTRGDITVFRALMRPFHMLESPEIPLKNPAILARILWMWMKPKSWKRQYYPPKLGPDRREMLQLLSIPGA
jgi:2-polyprenyl-6-methoxyphenol hydroxylase-like FAD-dependent oxidoreductase